VVRMTVLFWVITLCRLVGRYYRCRETQPPSSALKMETVRFSETLVSTYESTRRYNPEQHRHASELSEPDKYYNSNNNNNNNNNN
jgi:hypothetical protein